MIKRYIVLTTHGFTENDDMVSVDNMQVLGWAKGLNPLDAARNFKKEYSKLLEGYGNSVIMQEIRGNDELVFID